MRPEQRHAATRGAACLPRVLRAAAAAILCFLVLAFLAGGHGTAQAQGTSRPGAAAPQMLAQLQQAQPQQQQQLAPPAPPGAPAGTLPAQSPAASPLLFNQNSLADIPGPSRQRERLGQPTEAEGGPLLVPPLGDLQRNAGPATAVFGAALFTGVATSSSDAPNPNYILAPGDRVSVRTWGAVDAEIVGTIDPQGYLFVPNVGPIRLAGVRAGDLQTAVTSEVQRVYTQQVQVYATVLTTQRIGVFVTGFVRSPGRFAGAASDSVLDFLVRAGGVDHGRGSFRDIVLQRGGRTVASIDLYRFLLQGQLPVIRLQEGDTLVVARQRALIGADGAVRNNYLFEASTRGGMSGRELMDYARPLPSATNAVIRGVRGAVPFARYVTLPELGNLQLLDQDTVTFIADVAQRTIRVTIEGSRLYPSVLVADRDIQLCQLLDHVAVDPGLADTRSVFVLRPRLAAQQQRAINEALDRLERQLFMAVSPTTGVANIRASEAQLVSSYISRARRVQPEGRLVVSDGDGHCSPVRMEDGDVIVIPERQSSVLVTGEVTAPQAVIWRPDWRIADYIRAAGGYTPRGSSSTLMIRRPSGQTLLDPEVTPQPGDELVALPYLDPKYQQLASDFLALIFQIAVAARIFQ